MFDFCICPYMKVNWISVSHVVQKDVNFFFGIRSTNSCNFNVNCCIYVLR